MLYSVILLHLTGNPNNLFYGRSVDRSIQCLSLYDTKVSLDTSRQTFTLGCHGQYTGRRNIRPNDRLSFHECLLVFVLGESLLVGLMTTFLRTCPIASGRHIYPKLCEGSGRGHLQLKTSTAEEVCLIGALAAFVTLLIIGTAYGCTVKRINAKQKGIGVPCFLVKMMPFFVITLCFLSGESVRNRTLFNFLFIPQTQAAYTFSHSHLEFPRPARWPSGPFPCPSPRSCTSWW